jgi:preprotein translocase subunit YajC
MIRPQQKRMKDLQDSINAVKKGDQVVTGGGLIGKVTKVDETEVETRARHRTSRSARSRPRSTERAARLGGAKPAND